jgi:hypothetical protein
VEKETRNTIERATQRVRSILENDFAEQLQGAFDVMPDGRVGEQPGSHLTGAQRALRARIVAAIEHKRAQGMTPSEAVADHLRDSAFTTLNRFVALKMLEARGLVQECVSKGEASSGFANEFCGLAPGLKLPDGSGYRIYIESIFDELSTEVKVLFDRRDPASALWPRKAAFDGMLATLNGDDLKGVWGEDETIGWVYQFFNGQDERRKMREESAAPRNSRELAVRNQFFTPRYIVQFLTDNTLGRIWHEMRGTDTALAERCEYMVRSPSEVFPPRAKKDPRDLRVLDPACGSGHFLLYAFDLLLTIYEEAHGDPESPKSESTGRTLAEDYRSLGSLRKAIPSLILMHNLHGVDIDSRCTQIAQLALWMRAQRAYREFGVGREERSPIRRTNIVVAEPLVADEQIAKEFVAKLDDVELGRVFTALVDKLKLAGDLGLLLRVETVVSHPANSGKTEDLFAPSEERIRAALARFDAEEETRTSTRRRLFADDTAQAVGLLEIAAIEFDVVVMNPPFGDSCERGRDLIEDLLSESGRDLGAAFVLTAERNWAPHGHVGVLLPTGSWFKPVFESWRDEVFWGSHSIELAAHFGGQVLDGATVNASAFVSGPNRHRPAYILRCTEKRLVEPQLRATVAAACDGRNTSAVIRVVPIEVAVLPGKPFAYWLSAELRNTLERLPKFEGSGGTVKQGTATADELRFSRCWWEVALPSSRWIGFVKSGEFNPIWDDCPWVCVSTDVLRSEVEATGKARVQGLRFFGRPGVMFPRKSVIGFNPRLHPTGYGFGDSAPVAFPHSISAPALLAFLGSRPVEYLIGLFVGELQGQAGVYPLHYQVGVIQRLPWPGLPSDCQQKLEALAESTVEALRELASLDECSFSFAGLPKFSTFEELAVTVREHELQTMTHVVNQRAAADEIVYQAYGFSNSDRLAVHDAMFEMVAPAKGKWRHWFGKEGSDYDDLSIAQAMLSWFVSIAFGRSEAAFRAAAKSPKNLVRSFPLPSEVLVDDPGHPNDFTASVQDVVHKLGLAPSLPVFALKAIGFESDLRFWLSYSFFGEHIHRYSAGRRKAPIYWQLATPSARYSVWLHIHGFTKDTLFRVQNDYAAPKLTQEERRLESLIIELRDKATAAQRKELAAQEAFVVELRVFLEDVKRVAPLWNPNLDDGVIISFSPLWRLVPHHKAWQKELKATWDSLCAGEYDWAHLAMHLWPDRVVAKCATERSLAIAHGLEETFWVEGVDGKWKSRETPKRQISALVAERSSEAVKAAVKGLMDAPEQAGPTKRGRKSKAA